MWIKSHHFHSSLHTDYLPHFMNPTDLHLEGTHFDKIEIPHISTHVRHKKLERSLLRQPIFEWFRSLSVEQRQEITQIKDDALIQMVLQLSGYTNLQTLKISVDFNKLKDDLPFNQKFIIRLFDTHRASENKLNSEQILLDSVRIVCLSRSAILLSLSSLDDPEAFFDHLTQISEGHIFECSLSNHSDNYGDNPLWFSSLSFNSLAEWICSNIQKTMSRCYHRMTQSSSRERIFLQETSAIVLTREFIEFCQRKGSMDVDVCNKYSKNIRRWMDLKIMETTYTEITQLKQLCQKMVDSFHEEKTKILFDDFDELLMNKKKNKKPHKSNKNCKKQSSEIKENEDLPTLVEQGNNTQPPPKQQNNQQIFLEASHVFNKSDQNTQQTSEERGEEEELHKQICCQSHEQNIEFPQNDLKEQKLLSIQTEQMILCHSVSQSLEYKKKRKHLPKKKKKVSDKLADTLFSAWLETSIQSFVDSISIQSNKLLQARILVFQRIRHFVSRLYLDKSIEAVLFGSNAVGLSLITSDIDILLNGFDIETNQQLVQLLEKLSSQLKKMKWVVECSIYPLAKVPIIKLLINPNYGYLSSYNMDSQQILLLQDAGEYLQLKKPIDGFISVDITIDTKNTEHSHLGCLSTTFMRDCLENYQYLHPVVLALKYLLTKRSLNKPYKGGLSSYGLLIICTAYLKTYPQTSIGSALLGVMQFYSSQFRNQEQAIQVGNQCPCYRDLPLKKQTECDIPLSVIDPLNGRLMSSNCTSFTNIKEQLLQVYERLAHVKQLIKRQLSDLELVQVKLLYEKKKKVVEKFLKKYEKLYRIKDIIDQENLEY